MEAGMDDIKGLEKAGENAVGVGIGPVDGGRDDRLYLNIPVRRGCCDVAKGILDRWSVDRTEGGRQGGSHVNEG